MAKKTKKSVKKSAPKKKVKSGKSKKK